MIYKQRYSQYNLDSPPRHFGAVLITGARRSGKSTLAHHLLEEWGGGDSFSFDTPQDIERFRRDPLLFFSKLSTPCVLDEVQNVPEIFSYVKSQIDRGSNGSCRFIMTGGQQFQMMKNVSESLAGRVLIRDLHPFSLGESRSLSAAVILKRLEHILNQDSDNLRKELQGCRSDNDFVFEELLRGGYPPLLHIEQDSAVLNWFQAYLQTYIQRDIREISNVSDLSLFSRFVSLIAGRSGHVLNFSELGKDIGVSYKTAQHYISLLETSFIWRLLPAYFLQAEKRLSKRPKGILMDSGLGNYLTGIFSRSSLERSPNLGQIFESFVISDFIKVMSAFNLPVTYFHFRNSSGVEVDFLLEFSGRLIPIEIKLGASVQNSWGSGIAQFRSSFSKHKNTLGFVVSLNEECFEISKNIWNLPLAALYAKEEANA